DQVLASITIERIIGFLSALVLGLLGMVQLSTVQQFGERYNMIWAAASATLLLATLAFAASFSATAHRFLYDGLLRRWQGNLIVARLRQFHQTYMGYQDVKGALLAFFGLTLVEQLFPVLECAWLAWGMGIDVTLFQISGAVILTQLLSRVPISVDGLGVFEGVFVLLLAAVGIGVAEAVAIAIAGRVLQTISWLPWWFAHMVEGGRARPLGPAFRPVDPGSLLREKR
ncbi:MAG: flippase-like domain-containing protein, partial [Nitrospirae bacterium]|nr:flippase-like domain-containing protein [Nitrospirota bacterium]